MPNAVHSKNAHDDAHLIQQAEKQQKKKKLGPEEK